MDRRGDRKPGDWARDLAKAADRLFARMLDRGAYSGRTWLLIALAIIAVILIVRAC